MWASREEDVARGGELAASVVDDLTGALDEASRNLTRMLRGG